MKAYTSRFSALFINGEEKIRPVFDLQGLLIHEGIAVLNDFLEMAFDEPVADGWAWEAAIKREGDEVVVSLTPIRLTGERSEVEQLKAELAALKAKMGAKA